MLAAVIFKLYLASIYTPPRILYMLSFVISVRLIEGTDRRVNIY